MKDNWKMFLKKLPDDISDKILKFVFEENVRKAKKELNSEFNSIKHFIYYLIASCS
tara:strand:- start:189 stop:356 length:168 start_codon:yes stop_codon:yes gene_type:complete